ncbi:MAG: polysaccharide biosynthesis protein [Deltaproteobacteria bacterium]|nr:polysaccharide biosynthesis protein [Deltaproteobacteria bacterium]
MIPRKLHYCWLGGGPMSGQLEKCLSSWRTVLADYEIIKWDMQRFDVSTVPFVREACSVKKWAFAADYIRLHALYEEGGIYLDTDVYVRKRFDRFLAHDFFSAVEYHPSIVASQKTMELLNADGSRKNTTRGVPGIGVQAAVMGSVPGQPFVAKALEFYRSHSFIRDDGSLATGVIAPAVLARCAEEFGFRYVNQRQYVAPGMVFLETELVASTMDDATRAAIAVHCCAGSWHEKSFLRSIGRSWLGRRLRGRSTLGDIEGGIIR